MTNSEKETAATKKAKGFDDVEKAAMKERAKELKASKSKADGEADCLAKIAELPDPDRSIAARLHKIIKTNAPGLAAKTWYGMPAYTNKDGKIVCFYQSAQKFGTRYATLGFNDAAALDDGSMWPVAYALLDLTPQVETKISELLKKAVG